METPIGEEEDAHLGDFIEDPDTPDPVEAVSSKLLKEKTEEVLRRLTIREQKVLQLHFGLEDGRSRTLEEVGQEFGVTRERIRQLEAKALRMLRHPTGSRPQEPHGPAQKAAAMRCWPLILGLLLIGCGPRKVDPLPDSQPPSGVEITYLQPIPGRTPPVLQGKIRNDTRKAIRWVEFDLFYGPDSERELDPLVIRDIPARGFREFEVPLHKVERPPGTWRATFVRLEWEDRR